ncbi:myo-inositol-1(or 4)-monophosphatase [Candidatus Kinetoplastibacterium desouzaii TCC079E]|uniref:Inositol-1-monophosphatase n=1 Tax=Candidatus Kinetoplastidibacterium desouzai TCC079E TaxID=1208919 RepID=M1LTN5_9PROT|nr:inositol monophosphatase family protein [Candidatus Kinetoplastibacterium desouzaii]AGF46669.1 myo-inositol-1(or 4)-monophosphatase [Candidatus Kinetoplastibacterium desouzaii TCC079E]
MYTVQHNNEIEFKLQESYLHELLNLSIKAALNAATILKKYYLDRSKLVINKKSHNHFVTKADFESEKTIIEILKSNKKYSFGFVAEESENCVNDIATWYIDPLDGTTNFLHGIPHYAISIALVVRKGITISNIVLEKDTPVIGVVYDPNRDELFTSLLGSGSYLNGTKILCSKNNKLSDSIISTGIPSKDYINKKLRTKISNGIARKVKSIRKMGAASLDLSWVACGRYDGYVDLDLSPWDTAAGTILIRESNGKCEDILQQNPWPINGWILSGNNMIFENLQTIIAKFIL